MIYDLKLGFSVQSLGFKPCLHVTRHAEDPFSFGRALTRRAAIEPNENLMSIAKSFSGFTVIFFVDRIEGWFPFQSCLRGSFVRRMPLHRYFPLKVREEAREIRKLPL